MITITSLTDSVNKYRIATVNGLLGTFELDVSTLLGGLGSVYTRNH